MKSKVRGILVLGLLLTFTTGCGKDGLGKLIGDDEPVRAEALADDAMIDQMGSTSSFTTVKDLYVDANTAVVTDIEEDNTKVMTCILTLPNTEMQNVAHWIPAGTSFPVVAGKIGTDRSFALAMTEGEPFDVPRLSCWAFKDDPTPLTISFLKQAVAPSFSIDARQ